jgi:hypothetical protein
MKMDIVNRIVECEREYETINNFKGAITFQWFLSYKNPSWSKKRLHVGSRKGRKSEQPFGGTPRPEKPHTH